MLVQPQKKAVNYVVKPPEDGRICNEVIIIRQIVETRIYPNGERYTKAYFPRDKAITTINKNAQQARLQKKGQVMDIKGKDELKRREL